MAISSRQKTGSKVIRASSTSHILDPTIVGQTHYKVARRCQNFLQRYKDLQDIIAILGVDELSEVAKEQSGSVDKRVHHLRQPA